MVTVNKNETGFSLILALVATMVIGSAVLLASRHLQADAADYQRELRDVQAITLSDAAMAETLARLSNDPGDGGIKRTTFAGGTIGSSVATQANGIRRVTAWGRSPHRQATVTATVAVNSNGARVTEWTRHMSH